MAHRLRAVRRGRRHPARGMALVAQPARTSRSCCPATRLLPPPSRHRPRAHRRAGCQPATPPPPTTPAETVSQQNAQRSAADYLDFTAFSRTGLIGQLEFEGFSTEDATWGVDHLTVDWNEQAAKSATDYLDFTSFSRSGLIDQLVFEGFTPDQAEYGVSTRASSGFRRSR